MYKRQEEKEEKDGKYIRKERYSGAMSRSFYVGDELKQEDKMCIRDSSYDTLTEHMWFWFYKMLFCRQRNNLTTTGRALAYIFRLPSHIAYYMD